MSREVTLDPDNWDDLKELGHQMVEDLLSHLQNIRELPTTKMPEEALQKLMMPLTEEGEGEEQVYELVKENLLPYDVFNTRPNFWGLVAGTGSPFSILVDMLISCRNAGMPSFTEVPLYRQLTSWIQELLEVPSTYSCTGVNGGSEANFTGLAVARNAKATVDMKTKGMQSVESKMVLYGSEEIHHCLERSVELLGLGNEAIRWIPVDDNFSIKIDELEKKIKEDRENGFHPFCIIGCAGTVNTGAFDDLNALADICQKEDMWFHVDGAFGAWIKLSETHKHLADGLERADSIAVDTHKWMNMPYVNAFTLVKDKMAHYSTFVYGHDAKYLESTLGDRELDILTMMSSLALSRRNNKLHSYMLLKAHGKEKYRQLVQQNIDGISYLAELISKEPKLEITAPVVSNIVCFRYNPGNLSSEQLEKLNKAIMGTLWEEVYWMISDTTLHGEYTLRACNVNNRTKLGDFDVLVEKIKRMGSELENEFA